MKYLLIFGSYVPFVRWIWIFRIILEAINPAVNLEIFARVSFSRDFADEKNRENKPSRYGEITAGKNHALVADV